MELLRGIRVIGVLSKTVLAVLVRTDGILATRAREDPGGTYPVRMAFQTELAVRALDFGFCGVGLDAEKGVGVDGGFFVVEDGWHGEAWRGVAWDVWWYTLYTVECEINISSKPSIAKIRNNK